jgi:hypothetical protein
VCQQIWGKGSVELLSHNCSQRVSDDLDQYSLDRVKMFYKDAVDAGFKL